MATRNQRRRKARQQAIARSERERASESSHGDRMIAKLVKAADSRQPTNQDSNTWDPEKTIPPPLPPELLWSIFEQNAIHSGAINAKVADSVGRGWKLVAEDDTEDGASDDVDRLTRQLTDTLKTICTELTFTQLCQQAVRELDAIGWGAWEILRDKPGDTGSEIVGILPVPAMNVRAVKGTKDLFCVRRGDKKAYFKRFGVTDQFDYKTGDPLEDGGEDAANELIVFKHYTPRSPFYGVPPWVSALPPVAEFGAIREFNVSFFESGGQADRLIHVASEDVTVADETKDAITKQLEDARGVAHVSIVVATDSDTEVNVESLTPKQPPNGRESEFRGGKEDLKEEIRIAHQVPPGRLGIAAGGALAGNANDSMDDDYRYGVVEPLQDIIEAELERTLFGDTGFEIPGYTFEFEDKTQDDTQDEHERAMSGREMGVLSPNDAREKIGEDRVEDPAMDRYYIDGNPISTDPGVSDVVAVLNELKAALQAAVKNPGQSEQPTPGEGTAQDAGDVETAEQNVAASETRLRRSGWALFRRS
jgi:capsid portal protein